MARGVLVAISACAGLGLLTGCANSEAAALQEPAKAVRVEPLARADIEDLLAYPADLKPQAEVRIFSRIADRILSFPWEDGQSIRRNQRVVIIRTSGLGQGLEQVVAQTDALDAQIEHQELELSRLRRLVETGAIPEAELDRAEAAHRASQAQRRALSASRGQLAATVSDGVIVAPIDGVIADKSAEVGDMAVPSLPLCRIIQVDQLKVELRLIEADVPKVKVGQEVVLHLDAYPERTFRGQVNLVLPYLDAQTRTNTVEVTVDNPLDEATGKRELKPGMFGRAELVVERRPQVLVAPERALLLDNQILAEQKPGETLRKAFVVDAEGVAQKRTVRLGARKGSVWQVLDGLREGEQIVVRGQHGLKQGQRVEIAAAANE